MTYSGVTMIVLVSFGVLAWTTSQALRGVATLGMFRQLGITGTRGYHLAAYSIMLSLPHPSTTSGTAPSAST
jgi:hypothetical protein